MIKKNSFLKFIVAMSVLIAMLASCSNGDGSKDAFSGADSVSVSDTEASKNSVGEEISVSEENTESAISEDVLDNSEISDNSEAFDNSDIEESSVDSSQMVTDEIPEGYKVVRDDDGKTIVYGKGSLSAGVDLVVHDVGAINAKNFFEGANFFLDSEKYEGAYYYVAIDPREAVEIPLKPEEEKAYFESFGMDCSDKIYYVYFTFVTEEQMIALAKEVATAERPIPYAYISLVHENAKEEYIQHVEALS